MRKPSAPAARQSPRATLWFLAIIGGCASIGVLASYAWSLHGAPPFPKDGAGFIVGRDFFNTWLYGRAAALADPGRFYDHAVYGAWFTKLAPENILDHIWSYPPQFLLLAAPFGQLPYLAALFAWTLIGFLALYAAVRGSALRTFAILVSPAALFCVTFGQVSMFVAACSLGALRLLDRRPWLAGALIAAIAIKPQAGLLFPILLVATRRWRVLAAATLCTAALVALTSAIWGVGIWNDYLHLGIPAQIAEMRATAARLAPVSPTVMTGALLVGFDRNCAWSIQLGAMLVAALLVGIGCGRGALDARRGALFFACSAFASPYLLVHDLTALTAAAVLLAGETLTRPGKWLVAAVYFVPLFQQPLAGMHIPAAPLILVAFALWAVWPQWREHIATLRGGKAATAADPAGVSLTPGGTREAV